MTPDIRTHYMGLELFSPVVASSSELTNKLDNLKKLEEQGADALELNIFLQPSDFSAASAAEHEKIYFDVINMVLQEVSIPVSVKVSYYFTLLAQTLQAISRTGIKGRVLFNRFFDPDYDVENLKIVPTNVLSTPAKGSSSSSSPGCRRGEYESLDDFRGTLSQENIGNPAVYDRVQFVKSFRPMR